MILYKKEINTPKLKSISKKNPQAGMTATVQQKRPKYAKGKTERLKK